MIRLLRKQDLQALAVTFILLLALGLSLFLSVEASAPELSYPLSRELIIKLPALFTPGSWVSFAIAWLLILVQAFYFNHILNEHRVLHKNTFLPAFFFAYLCLLFPEQLTVNPELLGSTLIIFAIGSLFRMQSSNTAIMQLLNAGMCVGLALVMVPQVILLIPLLLVAIFLFRPAKANDLFQFLLGIVFPLYFAFIVAYLRDMQDYSLEYFSAPFLRVQFQEVLNHYNTLIVLCLIALILLIVLVRVQQNFFRNTIQVRKYQQFLIIYFFFALAVVFLGREDFAGSFLLVAAPVSTFLAYFFLPNKRAWMQELVFLLLLGALFFNQLEITF